MLENVDLIVGPTVPKLPHEIGAELDGLLPEESVSPGPSSGRAAELYELWGLSRSPEELEKERRRETFRRRFLAFLKGTAAMLLIAFFYYGRHKDDIHSV